MPDRRADPRERRAAPGPDRDLRDAAASAARDHHRPGPAVERGGGGQGYIRIPIPTARHSHAGARVCLRNGGPTKIALGGEAIPNHATIDGRDAGGRIRLAWYRPGSESWVSLTPAVAHRFGYGKAPWQGSWTLWLAALALVAALGAAGVAVVRSVPR